MQNNISINNINKYYIINYKWCNFIDNLINIKDIINLHNKILIRYDLINNIDIRIDILDIQYLTKNVKIIKYYILFLNNKIDILNNNINHEFKIYNISILNTIINNNLNYNNLDNNKLDNNDNLNNNNKIEIYIVENNNFIRLFDKNINLIGINDIIGNKRLKDLVKNIIQFV